MIGKLKFAVVFVASALFALSFYTPAAIAAKFPSKPIKLIVPCGAGGNAD